MDVEQRTAFVCDGCGEPDTTGLGADTFWFADNHLWNAVMGGEVGTLCPECFTNTAQAKGYVVGWRCGIVGEIETTVRAAPKTTTPLPNVDDL